MTVACAPPLRHGWTTGASATAAAAAAAEALRTGRFPDPVTVRLPGGQTPSFPLLRPVIGDGWAEATVIKDAGDDPDVTHGCLVVVRVRLRPPGSGLSFRAGEGVGTVTRPGLPLAVGEPAINPGPRAMIADNLGLKDAEIEISIPGGAELALKTLNGRLGIVGGLSILGTTGIVVPYSCAAWVDSIHRAVDVARASGLHHLVAVTGAASEMGVRTLYPGLPDLAVIDVGDFIGGLLTYLRRHPVEKLTIGGGFAKTTKLAAGHLNLHSKASDIDFRWLAGIVAEIGGSPDQVVAVRAANTALTVLELTQSEGLPLATAIAARAWAVAFEATSKQVPIEIAIFNRTGTLVGRYDTGSTTA